mmetsp:Transcript_219/g.476  ORF Transcript_219/g.476 Transcript_219/m.476 type:complete len:470 (-) Transcript_219:240-1649(-)
MNLDKGSISSFLSNSPLAPHVILFTEQTKAPLLYAQVSKVFAGRIVFGMVNYEEEALVQQFGVQRTAVPRLVLKPPLTSSKPIMHFDGGIEFTEICTFLANALHACSSKAAQQAPQGNIVMVASSDLQELQIEKRPTVILFTEKKQPPLIWQKMALFFHDTLCLAIVSDDNTAVRSMYGVQATPSFLALRPGTLSFAMTFSEQVGYVSIGLWLAQVAQELSTAASPSRQQARAVAPGSARKGGGCRRCFCWCILMPLLVAALLAGVTMYFESICAQTGAPMKREETGAIGTLLAEHGLGQYTEGLAEQGIEYLADFPLASEAVVLALKMKPIHANKLRHLKHIHPPPEAAAPPHCASFQAAQAQVVGLLGPMLAGFEYTALQQAGEQLLHHSSAAVNSLVDERTKESLKEYGLYKEGEHGWYWPVIRVTVFLLKGVLSFSWSALDACSTAWEALQGAAVRYWQEHVMLL